MKILTKGAIGALALVLASAINTSAIEGLQISVQCSNVVLRWPSDEFIGETYIVQYRPDLISTNPWITLTNDMPPDTGTNFTYFVHSNVVQNPCNCDGSGSFSSRMSSGGSMVMRTNPNRGVAVGLSRIETLLTQTKEPLAMLNNDWGSLLPAAIYPPGFDFSGFSIFDPASGEWLDGQYYTAQAAILRAALTLNGAESDGPEPGGGSGGSGGDTSFTPETGFYQVVREGVYVLGSSLDHLTNGSVSDIISIGFEAGNDFGILHDATVLVDGTRYRGVTPLINPDFYGSIQVDTSFLENGEHTFQVQVGWLNLDPSDPNNFLIHRSSDAITLTVSNVIYYPDWVDNISELGYAAYFAKTTCTNANWQIDIFDANTNYVQTLVGYTTNGIIEAYWDMLDTNGVARTNVDIDTEFSSLITVGDPVTKKPPTQPAPYPYPDHARWAIAYQDTFSFMANSNVYYNAVYQMGSLGANAGGATTVFPSYPTNGQCFPIRYMNTNQPINFSWVRSDEAAVMTLLTNRNFRNFYYNGHGGPESISVFLTSDKIQRALKRQYYRFVFLDACSTANGGLPAAFGINYKSMKTLTDFQTDKSRPRAFLGYDRDVYYSEAGSFTDSSSGVVYGSRVRSEVTYFLTNFEFYWYFNYDLQTSIYNAIRDTPFIGPGWQTGDNLRLYGYDSLGLDSYNYKTDWSN